MAKSAGKKIIVWALALLIILMGSAFILFSSKSFQKTAMPRVTEIRKFEVSLVFDTANVKANIGVKNPLPIDIKIDSLSYTILHNADTLAKGNNSPEKSLKSRSTTFMPLHIGINYNVMEKKMAQLQGQDSTDIEVNLTLFFKLPVVGLQSIDINKSMPVSVPKLPVYDITDTKITDFGLGKGVEMELTIAVNNNNLEDLYISNVVYHVQVEDFIDATEKPGKTFKVKSGQISTHKVPLHLGIREAAKAGIKQRFGDKTWKVTISGTADVKSSNPMMQHIQIRFFKTNMMDASKAGKQGSSEPGTANKDEKSQKEENRNFLEKIKDKVKEKV